MQQLIDKYANKLVDHGLCDKSIPLVAGLDAELLWNRDDKLTNQLNKIFKHLNINSLVFSPPREPFFSIINFLAENTDHITPEDCETRTFLHSIPVIKKFDVDEIIKSLKSYKGVIIKDYGIVTYGTVTPEQAFITFSSICFSTYVKFFKDYYDNLKNKKISKEQQSILEIALTYYNKDFITNNSISCRDGSMARLKNLSNQQKTINQQKNLTNPEITLNPGPLKNTDDIISAMKQVGSLTVDYRLVDSFFGNLSFRLDNTIYISQTGSSLDELTIDACPVDDSSCVGVTASSEFSAHREIFITTDTKAILHAHPKFSVIMSLICDEKDCEFRGSCHIKCPKKRFIQDVPIVPGEVGTGQYGLCNTLPPAVKGNLGVIVYGHGLFTVSNNPNFIQAFASLVDIEDLCMQEYTNKIDL